MCKKLLILALGVLLLASCSTQKAGWSNVAYHNTTARYNVWWNGNESLKKGVTQLETTVKDDYTRLLPVYKMGTKEQAAAANPLFDRAIEKGIKGVKKHSIIADGAEHVPYIPKCYLLTAYASFYKRDLVTAASTSQMISAQFPGTATGDEAALLLARCSAMEGRYFDAESALDELVAAAGKGAFARSLKLPLYLAMAECTMPQEKYKKSVQFLKMALDEHPSDRQRARICYILGQVYQRQDKRPTATKYYEQVLKCHPGYEMEFNTRLNIISCADPHHTDRAKLERLLVRMERDKKNAEFLDQILFAKGEMYMGMRETKKAVECFRASVAKSVSNPAQKARSAIRLGGILYDKYQDYDRAQLYYDTAMAIIKSDYPLYESIRSRYDLLTSLTSYTRVLDRNDSLLRVADMPVEKQQLLIAEKIAQLKKAEEEAKERELLAQLAGESKAAMNTLQGDWYFYNANTVQKGKESFRQRWGMRQLEDYWFLSKKGLLGMNMLTVDAAADTAESDSAEADSAGSQPKDIQSGGNPNDPHDPAFYLKDLPTTQAARDSLHAAAAVCLLNAGYIYYDGVNNIPKALECYQRLVNDYTDNSEIVQAFFMLYKIYDKQGNTPNASYYRNMVLMGFPDSDFSNLILDEDYYKEIIRRSQLVNEDYEEVYTHYRKHRYDKVLQGVAAAKELYDGHPMLGKFRYWEGLAYARMDQKAQAIGVFEAIVKEYPAADSIVPLARLQLDYLRGEGGKYMAGGSDDEAASSSPAADASVPSAPAGKGEKSDDAALAEAEQKVMEEARLFRYKEAQPHYVVILLNDKKIRATDMQMKVADFNMTYYANAGLKVSPMMFSDSTQMVTINRFKDAAGAMDYYRHLQRDESPLQQYSAADYQVFVISVQNYTTFYNRKRVDAYQYFFTNNYLTQ